MSALYQVQKWQQGDDYWEIHLRVFPARILIGDGDLRGPSNELCNLHDNNWQSDDESSESWAYVIMNPSEIMILCNRWYYAGTIL